MVIIRKMKCPEKRCRKRVCDIGETVSGWIIVSLKCPNCGSTSITAGQSNFPLFTGFFGPRITIGEIDFPLFTGMIGSGKTVNRCANCGHKWKP